MRTPILILSLLGISSVCEASLPSITAPDWDKLFQRIEPRFVEPAGPPSLKRGLGDDPEAVFTIGKPELVMPVGSGTLSAMVAYGNRLEIHLSKTGYFGRPDARAKHPNPWLSPGHLSITPEGVNPSDISDFTQSIDFSSGTMTIRFRTPKGWVTFELAGDRETDSLVISGKNEAGATRLIYTNWRSGPKLTSDGSNLIVTEDHGSSRGNRMALVIGDERQSTPPVIQEGTADIPLGSSFRVVVAAALAPSYPPVEEAMQAWKKTAGTSEADLKKSRLKWWRNFWGKAWIDLQGAEGELLTRLWFTSLYSYASSGAGKIPPKFNGGPGLVHKDLRTWGEGFWWQNQRELIWPMNAAGRHDFASALLEFYSAAFDTGREQAKRWKLDGVFLREWIAAPVIDESALPSRPPMLAYDPAAAPPEKALERRMDPELRGGGYTSHIFSCNAELLQLMLDHIRHTGDEEFAKRAFAPWLNATTLFSLSLLTLEKDGLWHVKFADANENWWRVDNASSLVAAIRYSLHLAVKFGPALGMDPKLVEDASDRLSKLTPLPTAGGWEIRRGAGAGKVLADLKSGNDLLAPFDLVEGVEVKNQENPELAAIFPFALIDLHSTPEKLSVGRATFEHRKFKNTAGWSQCSVQSARLGLPQTLDVILDHANKHQKWPYGGWNSPGQKLYQGSQVTEVPYFDSAGVNMTGVQEMLLQSHDAPDGEAGLFLGGGIRIAPAVSPSLSGTCQLHAQGGFIVRIRLEKGITQIVAIDSTRDSRLRMFNPYPRATIYKNGVLLKTSSDRLLDIETKTGDAFVFSPTLTQSTND